jgi:peroxiredoxin
MRNLLLIGCLAIIAVSCNESNKYRIAGQIDNGKGQWLYLERMDLQQHKVIDSVKLDASGSFKFGAERLVEPTFFSLKLKDDNFITLLADSTEKILVNADAKNMEETYTVEHSLGSGYIKILNRKLRVTKQATDSLVKVYASLGESDWVQKKQIEDEYLTVIEAHKKFIGNFVMENPRSFASYYALLLELNNAPIMNVIDKKDQIFFSTIATSLNVMYPESDRVKHLYSFVLTARNMQRRSELTQQLLAQAHTGVPNIEAPTPSGINVSLKSLKGNVVLLSFWASFDQNSRRENRNLKRVYGKYKSRGFEIFQFSLDQSRVLWENALEKDGIDWISVSDLKSSESPCARTYNVSSIPSNYLISRDGEIIGKDLFGARLEEKLAELLR